MAIHYYSEISDLRGHYIRLHCECVRVCVCVRESVRESVSSKSE
jgi:hypothetical protein